MATTAAAVTAWYTPGCPDACPIHTALTGMRTQVGRAWDEQQAITQVFSAAPVRAQGAALREHLGQVLDDLAGLAAVVPDRPEPLALAWRYYQRLEEHARQAEAAVAALAVTLAARPGLQLSVYRLQQSTVRMRGHLANIHTTLADLPGDQPLLEHGVSWRQVERVPLRSAS